MINVKELQSSLEYLQFHGVQEISIESDVEIRTAIVIQGESKDLFKVTLYPSCIERESFVERTTREVL